MSESPETKLLQELHQQTAKIAWSELQRFFAQGRVLQLDQSLDLVEIAAAMASDSSKVLEPLVEQGLLLYPSNDQARQWFQQETELWSVVVAPYVLVQDNSALVK